MAETAYVVASAAAATVEEDPDTEMTREKALKIIAQKCDNDYRASRDALYGIKLEMWRYLARAVTARMSDEAEGSYTAGKPDWVIYDFAKRAHPLREIVDKEIGKAMADIKSSTKFWADNFVPADITITAFDEEAVEKEAE